MRLPFKIVIINKDQMVVSISEYESLKRDSHALKRLYKSIAVSVKKRSSNTQ